MDQIKTQRNESALGGQRLSSRDGGVAQLLPNYETKLLQDRIEHDAFIDLLVSEGVRSYLEIGLGWGGSIWRVGNALAKGSRVVGLDRAPNLETRASIREMLGKFDDGHLIIGDSTDATIVAAARDLGPFDCIFIDGDHSYDGVKSDWLNYGPMARIVAFHDISWNETWVSKVPGRATAPMGVPQLWNEIAAGYRHREFKFYKLHNYYGIGVLWTR